VNSTAIIQELSQKLEELWYELEDIEHKDLKEHCGGGIYAQIVAFY
jgi:hypothetical protein